MAEIELFKYIALIALGGFQWFMKRTINKLEADVEFLRREIGDIKIHYLHKEEFKDFKEELRNLLLELKQDIKELGKK